MPNAVALSTWLSLILNELPEVKLKCILASKESLPLSNNILLSPSDDFKIIPPPSISTSVPIAPSPWPNSIFLSST